MQTNTVDQLEPGSFDLISYELLLSVTIQLRNITLHQSNYLKHPCIEPDSHLDHNADAVLPSTKFDNIIPNIEPHPRSYSDDIALDCLSFRTSVSLFIFLHDKRLKLRHQNRPGYNFTYSLARCSSRPVSVCLSVSQMSKHVTNFLLANELHHAGFLRPRSATQLSHDSPLNETHLRAKQPSVWQSSHDAYL